MKVTLSRKQLERLQKISAKQNVSVDMLVNQIINQWLNTSESAIHDPEERKNRILLVSGKYQSGLKDVSVHHDKYLAEDFL